MWGQEENNVSFYILPRLRYLRPGKRFHDRKHWGINELESFFEDQDTVTVSTERYPINLGGAETIHEFDEDGEEMAGEKAAEYVWNKFEDSKKVKNALDIIEAEDNYEFHFEMRYTLNAKATEDQLYASAPERKTEITGPLHVDEPIDDYLQAFEPAIKTDGGEIGAARSLGGQENAQQAGETGIGRGVLRGVYESVVSGTDDGYEVTSDTARELLEQSAGVVKMKMPMTILSPPLKNVGGRFDKGPTRTLEAGRPLKKRGQRPVYTYGVDGKRGVENEEERGQDEKSVRRGHDFKPAEAQQMFEWLDEEYGVDTATIYDTGHPETYELHVPVSAEITWGTETIAIDETVTYEGILRNNSVEEIRRASV